MNKQKKMLVKTKGTLIKDPVEAFHKTVASLETS